MRLASASPTVRRTLLAAAALIPIAALAVPAAQAATADAPTIKLADDYLSGAVGATGDPTVKVTVGEDGTDADNLKITATDSSKSSVAGTSDVHVTGSGATRTVSVDAQAQGYTDLTLQVSDGDSTATTTLHYAASPKVEHSDDARYLTGASDASASVDVGGGYIVVANDEDNTLRLYDGSASGAPVKTWKYDGELNADKEVDLEGGTRVGDTIYWTGSLGNNKKGESVPDHDTVFTTKVSGSGADTDLDFGHSAHHLRDQLVDWDKKNGDRLGFAAGTADGQVPKSIGGFNVEGLEFAPGSDSTAYVGFRAPLVPPKDGGKALLVPVTNMDKFVTGSDANFGDPIELDLGGLSVRDIRRNDQGQYLILAGSWSGDDNAPQALYRWDGKPGDQPSKLIDLPAGDAGNWEAITSVPDLDSSGARVQLITDDGSADLYGDGTAAKDLGHPEWQKSRSTWFTVN